MDRDVAQMLLSALGNIKSNLQKIATGTGQPSENRSVDPDTRSAEIPEEPEVPEEPEEPETRTNR